MAPTTVLITGANRGLGEGLLSRYLAKPDHTVIAANRNPAHPTSQALADLPKGEGSRLIVVKWDASVDQDALDAVAELQEKHGIEYLDIVIANAGINQRCPAVADLKLDELRFHMGPNVYGFVATYQATRPLLQKSKKGPIFIPIGSTAGCIENQPPITNAAYGPTKAMVSWYTVRINAEDSWLNAFVMNPGWVQTELGDRGARELGFEKAFITVKESCDGMLNILDDTSKEKHGGKMIAWNGDVSPW
ncbi:aflatoxin biosynthesis ketoreductase nor-1 [Apiospora arundinis]|uniref:Aflatoxin biosynthesis ketoreductase nor-1 n=1 Tax=Apiospora arundinis TaxID=335852 RepID=A0ABR2JHA3_9PEZI